MCGQVLAHEQENFNNFPCSGILGDFRGFRMGGLTFDLLSAGGRRGAARTLARDDGAHAGDQGEEEPNPRRVLRRSRPKRSAAELCGRLPRAYPVD